METTSQFTSKELGMADVSDVFRWIYLGMVVCVCSDTGITWWVHHSNADRVLALFADDSSEWTAHPMGHERIRPFASAVGEDAVVGVIDETGGEIIGYAHADSADMVLSGLNGTYGR